MSNRGNSGFIDIDRRFGSDTGDTKGIVNREQHFLERTQGRLDPITEGPGGNPTFWVDADSLYITLAGSDVSNWADRSGNGLDLPDPPTTTDRPLYNSTDSNFNDLPSVFFGTNEYMETADDALLACPDGFTVYIVSDISSFPSTFSSLISRTNTTSWSQGWGILYYSTNWRFWVNNWNDFSTRVDMGSNPIGIHGAHIFKLHYDKTNIVGQIFGPNGAAETTKAYSATVTDPSSEGITVAWGGSDSFDINASYGEIIFYNSPLSDEDQTTTEEYLSNKYNISLT